MVSKQGIISVRRGPNGNAFMLTTKQLYSFYLEHPTVQTDTRHIQRNSLFFALKGPNFNGNSFAWEALEKGAAYAIIDEPEYETDDRILLVPDVLSTLQQLAAYHRNQFSIPFIAITGSNGKTTTKELSYAVLRTTFRTYATEGNLNNHIGIPLTLLRIRPETEIALIEMGANHQKEIESYCRIVRPTHGLITNIGKAHLEGFGGLEGVKRGKGELFDALRDSNGVAFACADFPYFKKMTEGLKTVHWYGTSGDVEVNGKVAQKEPYLVAEVNYGKTIPTKFAGTYNLYNILAAATIGKYFGVSEENVNHAIAGYNPGNARSQVIHKESNTFILDAYNANPSSMRAAIADFAARRHNSVKSLFLGAMMELGTDSTVEHQNLIDFIQQYDWKDVILVGGDFSETTHPYVYFPDVLAAKQWFTEQNYQNVTALIKGSRSIGMEKMLA